MKYLIYKGKYYYPPTKINNSFKTSEDAVKYIIEQGAIEIEPGYFIDRKNSVYYIIKQKIIK